MILPAKSWLQQSSHLYTSCSPFTFLNSELIIKRESSVGRWTFLNKITEAAFSLKLESKVFDIMSQHRDDFGMGDNAHTHTDNHTHAPKEPWGSAWRNVFRYYLSWAINRVVKEEWEIPFRRGLSSSGYSKCGCCACKIRSDGNSPE